jgi:transposase InsO family protein
LDILWLSVKASHWMSWKVETMVVVRREFVELCSVEGSNISELCRRFGVSRKTGYKWLSRYRTEGVLGLQDQTRRPHHSPSQTSSVIESRVLALREAHPAWGGRKLRRRLEDQGVSDVPSASTITEILRREGKLSSPVSSPGPHQRFERERPNELWQMDFKGHFGLGNGGRCHPLTVLDDHSRFSLVLQACGREQGTLVQSVLSSAFRVYGLPETMLMDNGSPWGNDRTSPWTPLTVWLLRLGVRVIHGRPYHPQTQGKEERFHRTLRAEVLQGRTFADLIDSQHRFDAWRPVYNFERPHEALNLSVPGSRYRPSSRRYPEQLPELEFSPVDSIRKVQQGGELSFHGQTWHVSKAFKGQQVGLRPTKIDGVWQVWFGPQCLGDLNLHEGAEKRRVVRRRPGVPEGVNGGGTDYVRCAHSVRSTPIQE